MDVSHRVEQLLTERVGLNLASLPKDSLSIALRYRMEATGISEEEAYWRIIHTSSEEFNALLDLLLVSETWFFRDATAFEYIIHYYKEKWIDIFTKLRKKRPLRILCVGCSTGEEPYSVAMRLLDAGVSSRHFTVDAVDISESAIQRGRSAIYGSRSFRGKDSSVIERHFNTNGNHYQLRPRVASLVNFSVANLLDTSYWYGHHTYDIIFCRHLLIYLQPTSQKEALDILSNLLEPAGILLVAPSELGLPGPANFVRVKYPRSFAFRKLGDEELKTHAVAIVTQKQLRQVAFSTTVISKKVIVPVLGLQDSAVTEDPSSKQLLSQAGELADSGQLDQATELCLEYLKKNKDSAEAYFILGLVQHAKGADKKAEKHFHKVIYLNPNHYEALVYMSLILDNQGEAAKAELYRERAARVLARNTRAK